MSGEITVSSPDRALALAAARKVALDFANCGYKVTLCAGGREFFWGPATGLPLVVAAAEPPAGEGATRDEA